MSNRFNLNLPDIRGFQYLFLLFEIKIDLKLVISGYKICYYFFFYAGKFNNQRDKNKNKFPFH